MSQRALYYSKTPLKHPLFGPGKISRRWGEGGLNSEFAFLIQIHYTTLIAFFKVDKCFVPQ